MSTHKRKAIIDDGMNPELVAGADFDGYLGIPIIRRPDKFVIPSDIVPFTKRNRIEGDNIAVGFYEMDNEFSDVLISPENYLEEFSQTILITPEKARLFISPDCSLYRNAPLAVQISNVYRNRTIGFYFQNNGAYVIPQIRWGNELTYTTRLLPERVAFLGVEKHSVEVGYKEGDTVKAGQAVLITEAMKMETEVQAAIAGKVVAIHVAKGDRVTPGEILIEIEG